MSTGAVRFHAHPASRIPHPTYHHATVTLMLVGPGLVGLLVHYVSHGTPIRADGTQAYTRKCRSAIITEVDGDVEETAMVGLWVINPTGLFFHCLTDGGCRIDKGSPVELAGWSCDGYHHEGGTWHFIRGEDPDGHA